MSKVLKSFDLEYQEQISDILSLVSRFEKKFLYVLNITSFILSKLINP